MTETMPQIDKALEKVCANAIILYHKRKYKKDYVTKVMRIGAGALN